MVFAFSTSSPLASVAIFTTEGELIYSGSRQANMKASEACFSLLQESGFHPNQGTLFVADIGPGSFTGTRVGVTMAKTFAYLTNTLCAGANAFDLISSTQTTVLPSKKGEWFVRLIGNEPFRSSVLPDEPYLGFGGDLTESTYPLAERFLPLLPNLQQVKPEVFVPVYLIEPSISVQKKGFGLAGGPK